MPPLDPGTNDTTLDAPASRGWGRRLGDVLLEMGVVAPAQVAAALARQRGLRARLGEILHDDGALDVPTLDRALAAQLELEYLERLPPSDAATDARARRLPVEDALRLRAVPIGRDGTVNLIATAAPERLADLYDALPDALLPCRVCLAPALEIEARLSVLHGTEMARQAETRPPRRLSARGWVGGRAGAFGLAVAVAIGLGVVLAPMRALQVATLAGLAVTALNLGLRLLALVALARGPRRRDTGAGTARGRLPRISLLIPLHKETGIVGALIARLARLDYPRPLLDVLLVVEAGDMPTRRALAAANLPGWMRVVAVPDGHPRTKPRAMNYALGFARGEIVGVYDAEDAPDPDQLLRVAERFAAAPSRVACLQGCLDYYNPRLNWMARCFTIEYATWFPPPASRARATRRRHPPGRHDAVLPRP